MHRLQEVVRLHRQGESDRRIAKLMKMGRDTVRSYLSKLSPSGLLDGSPDDLPSASELSSVLDAQSPLQSVAETRRSTVEQWREQIASFVKKGVGPTAIHQHLRLHDPDFTGSLSAVKRMCVQLKKAQGPSAEDVAIPVETLPGEIAQVDFGYAGLIYDPVKGVRRKAWFFVMQLAFSRRMYVDIVFDQKIATWLEQHVRAFEFFGGVPEVIVPDNLKSAVIRCAFGVDDELVLNRSYRELARAYGFKIDPTPPRSPAKKGKVERSVSYIRQSFFSTHESIDIKVDREDLARWNLEVADRRIHGTTRCRPIDLFEEVECEALLPLPKQRWKTVIWKKAKLHNDSHIQVDYAFYSAPWKHIGKELWVRATTHEIEIFNQDESLCRHARVSHGKRSTNDLHLPDSRVDLRHRSRSYWLNRARLIGPEVEHLVEEIFGSDDVLLQLRRVQSVVKHLDGFPPERARNAAARALHFRNFEYRSIKNILAKGLDFHPLPKKETRAWSSGSTFARRPRDNHSH